MYDSYVEMLRNDTTQWLAFTQYQFRSPLAVLAGPEVFHGVIHTHLGKQERVNLLDDGLEQLDPIGLQLLLEKRLGSLEIFDPGETVIVTAVADFRPIHLSSQPLPAIEIDVNRKGKPGLQTHTHEAEHRMHPVVVQEETL